jgi:hypothetical protein
MQDASTEARRTPSIQRSSKSRNVRDINTNTSHKYAPQDCVDFLVFQSCSSSAVANVSETQCLRGAGPLQAVQLQAAAINRMLVAKKFDAP